MASEKDRKAAVRAPPDRPDRVPPAAEGGAPDPPVGAAAAPPPNRPFGVEQARNRASLEYLHHHWQLPDAYAPEDGGAGAKGKVVGLFGRLTFRVLGRYLREERDLMSHLVQVSEALERRCDQLTLLLQELNTDMLNHRVAEAREPGRPGRVAPRPAAGRSRRRRARQHRERRRPARRGRRPHSMTDGSPATPWLAAPLGVGASGRPRVAVLAPRWASGGEEGWITRQVAGALAGTPTSTWSPPRVGPAATGSTACSPSTSWPPRSRGTPSSGGTCWWRPSARPHGALDRPVPPALRPLLDRGAPRPWRGAAGCSPPSGPMPW